MRQAIIVKNPKWEPFTKVSDEFKKLSDKDSGILVVRGRCKEKGKPSKLTEGHGKQKPESAEALAADLRKTGAKPEAIEAAVKAFKPVKAAAAVLLAMLFLAFSANAQTDITAKTGGSTIAGLSTNTATANGVNGWNIDQIAVLQFSVVGTNAATTNACTLRGDVSDDGTAWATNQFSVAATPRGTNWGTSITRITNSVGGKYFRINQTESLNAATVTYRLTLSLKEQ